MLWRKAGAEGMGVLVGAAHSTAEYARMQGLPVPRVCNFCHARVVPSCIVEASCLEVSTLR